MHNPLFLIPTPFELRYANSLRTTLPADCAIELCGFGSIVAAARTAQLIAQYRPQSVVLLGIAGTIHKELQVGAAYEFSEVVSYGIGIGTGAEYKTATEVGWTQWQGALEITDAIELRSPRFPAGSKARQLLTVCAGSADAEDVLLRQEKFPHAVAEDMEGFAVAVACKLANVSLRIIRGISNRAGDRDKQNWRVAEAMHSAVNLAMQEFGDTGT